MGRVEGADEAVLPQAVDAAAHGVVHQVVVGGHVVKHALNWENQEEGK